MAAGGVFAATNTNYKAFELVHHFKVAKVKWVLAAPEFLEPVSKVADECKLERSNILVFDSYGQPIPAGHTAWSHLFQHGEQDWIRFNDKTTAEDTLAALLFSSGTTGLPKAVMLSHKNFIAQHTLVNEHKPKPFASRRLYMLPLFHAATAPSAYCSPLRSGEQGYIASRFDTELWFQCMEKYKITDAAVVPPLVVMAIMSPLREKYSLKSVRIGFCGAAPLDAHPQSRFKALLSEGSNFTQVWGSTETCCIGFQFDYGEGDVSGSVGKPIANLDIKLVDDNGKDITQYGVRGEICIRGPTVTKGYYMNEETNKKDFHDGYWHSGDIAYCDEETKKWYIVDRKKVSTLACYMSCSTFDNHVTNTSQELIKVRGFQVAPAELEGVLLSHPDIIDCAIIGVQFGRDESEFPRAYVVKKPGSSAGLTEEDVKTFLAERLVYYKRLDGGVKFMEAIPKTASGKILKRLLREQAAKEVGAKL